MKDITLLQKWSVGYRWLLDFLSWISIHRIATRHSRSSPLCNSARDELVSWLWRKPLQHNGNHFQLLLCNNLGFIAPAHRKWFVFRLSKYCNSIKLKLQNCASHQKQWNMNPIAFIWFHHRTILIELALWNGQRNLNWVRSGHLRLVQSRKISPSKKS